MEIMNSMPQLDSEHDFAVNVHQADWPSTAPTHNPMALNHNKKTDFDGLTNMLAKVDISPAQPPTRHSNGPTDLPTNNNQSLPVELWMRVFDYLHNATDYARPSVTMAYKRSLAIHSDTIKAAQTLPPFEKRSWKLSRTLYHIDRTSRAAALKLRLCLRVLAACKTPLHPIEQTQLVFDLIKAGVYKQSSPSYVAIQIDASRDESQRRVEAGIVVEMVSGVFDHLVVHSLGLRTAKHVVLLDRCNWDTREMVACGREIEGAVYEFWRRNDIPAGVVEIV
jgi:hypothetical protein